MHCSNDSIKGWTDELIEGGWLIAETKGRRYKPGERLPGCRFVYTLLDGSGQPLLKSGTDTPPKNRRDLHPSRNQEGTPPESRREPLLKAGVEVRNTKDVPDILTSLGSNEPSNDIAAAASDCASLKAGAPGAAQPWIEESL